MNTQSAPECRNRSAFTLIELLVVIAIIAILAAILFPVFAQARQKARQAACLSNMKQIGTAVAMYTQDFDELVPPSENYPNGSSATGIISWPTMIQPYIKNEDVFACPGADETPKKPGPEFVAASNTRLYVGVTVTTPTLGGDGTWVEWAKVRRLSYARNLIPSKNGSPWNAMIANRPTNKGKTYPGFVDYNNNLKCGWVGSGQAGIGTGTTTSVSLAEVADVAKTIHIVDAMAGGAPPADSLTYGASMRGLQQEIRTDMYNDATPSKVDARHSGGYVVLYGDGHSGWRKWGTSEPCDWTIQDDVCN